MLVIHAGGLKGKVDGKLKQLSSKKFVAGAFLPLRNFAWLLVRVRNNLNPKPICSVEVPVISVGNVTFGGTGKTPFSRWLARQLAGMGHKPAILTPLEETADEFREHIQMGWFGTENQLLVYGGRDRVANARRAIADGATVIVLDDGFQYRSLSRNLDIVLWDATDWLHPFNLLLREPLPSLHRTDCVVLSKADGVSEMHRSQICKQLEKWAGEGKVVAGFDYQPAKLLKWEDGKVEAIEAKGLRAVIATSIANPLHFARTVRKSGFEVAALICFPDHHRFTASDAQFVNDWAKRLRADCVLTTAKDFVKWQNVWQLNTALFVLLVRLNWIWGENALLELIRKAAILGR